MLLQHGIQYRHAPVLKLDIVVIWHNQVADPVQAPLTQHAARKVEVPDVGVSQTLDEVFLHTPCSGYQDVNLWGSKGHA